MIQFYILLLELILSTFHTILLDCYIMDDLYRCTSLVWFCYVFADMFCCAKEQFDINNIATFFFLIHKIFPFYIYDGKYHGIVLESRDGKF